MLLTLSLVIKLCGHSEQCLEETRCTFLEDFRMVKSGAKLICTESTSVFFLVTGSMDLSSANQSHSFWSYGRTPDYTPLLRKFQYQVSSRPSHHATLSHKDDDGDHNTTYDNSEVFNIRIFSPHCSVYSVLYMVFALSVSI